MGYATQNTVNFTHSGAYAGTVNKQKPHSIDSKVSTDAALINYGVGVVTDGADGVKNVVGDEADLSTYAGMAIRDYGHLTFEADKDGYSKGQNVGVCPMGEVYCLVCEDVTADQEVFLRIGATDRGLYCNAAGTDATKSLKLPGVCKFKNDGAKGTIVKATFNLG